jgi:hypothetical protein
MKSIFLKIVYGRQRLKSLINQKIVKPNYNITYFEGGLGSQLLSFIEYQNKKIQIKDEQFVNVDYFHSDEVYQHSNGLTHWKWRLDHYGHTLDFFRNFDVKIDSEKFRRPTGLEQAKYNISNRLFLVTQQINDLLPIQSTPSQRMEIFFEGRSINTYGVIHIRKGDYLNVASRLVGIEDILNTINALKYLLPKNLVFVSDGVIEDKERASIENTVSGGSSSWIRYFDSAMNSIDETFVHDLMRKSTFLMTSNSTFSFSAALLNFEINSTILFPLDFYGEAHLDKSSPYREMSKFGVLEKHSLKNPLLRYRDGL